jgi:hypothetical protein
VIPGFQIIGGDGFAADGGGSSDWWLSGGVDSADVIAAYQPKGASTLAESYVNLADPGTYDAYPGNAPYLTADGWMSDRNDYYLETGIYLPEESTIIVSLSNIQENTNNYVCSNGTSGQWRMMLFRNGRKQWWFGSRNFSTDVTSSTGVIAISGPKVYLDGTLIATISSSVSGASPTPLRLMAWSTSNGINGNMESAAVYSTNLSDAEVSAISSAMAAL